MTFFWPLALIVIISATLAGFIPVMRKKDVSEFSDKSKEAQIYIDQLDEIDRDLGDNRILASEAEAARREISRRLLAAEENVSSLASAEKYNHRWIGVSFLAVIVSSAMFYVMLGRADLPDQSLQARLNVPVDVNNPMDLLQRTEHHLDRNPQDGRGWSTLAPIYVRMGRFSDAVEAYQNAIDLIGETAETQAALGEAVMAENGGLVTEEAQKAFQRASLLDENAIKPKFYLAVATSQQGDLQKAIKEWEKLLARPGGGETWRQTARTELTRLRAQVAATSSSESASASDNPQILAMVQQLADRIDENGGSEAEWVRLIRSYGVLGDNEALEEAIESAKQVFNNDENAMKNIEAEAERARQFIQSKESGGAQ